MGTLGKVIRQKRIEKELSLRDLGTLCGLSHSYIDSLEKGVDPRTDKSISPTIETLEKIAKGLNLPLNELLTQAGLIDDPSDREPAIFDTHRRIESALADDPDADELLSFWQELKQREDLFLLFKQVRPLSNDSIRRVIRVIKAIEEEEQQEFNR